MHFLRELSNEGINYFQDLENISPNFESKIKEIKGQKSGISLQYFYMLAGNDKLIKPDRMVIRYIESIVKQQIPQKYCQIILEKISLKLEVSGINISPRALDNAIWNYQRNIKQWILIDIKTTKQSKKNFSIAKTISNFNYKDITCIFELKN